MELKTPNDYDAYHFIPANKGSIKFKVRASNDAHIALTPGPAVSLTMLEVFIGGWRNSRSIIRKNRERPDVSEAQTPGILNGVEFRAFWIRWLNGLITVGREGETAPFLSYKDPTPFPINFVGYATGWDTSGSWIIEEIKTPDDYDTYKFVPTSDGFIKFKVRASNDAHIALTSGPSISMPMLEVFIGGWGNSKSVIRKNRQRPDVSEAPTPGILNAEKFRAFWIRWLNGVITVGHDEETAPFLSYEDPTPFPINFVGYSTGSGATGLWIIEDTALIEERWLAAQPPQQNVCGRGYWVFAKEGKVPLQAVEGGKEDNDTLFVARVRYKGALIPGKLHPRLRVCFFGWCGSENESREYEVLCGASGRWVTVSDGAIPPTAIPGGETETGEPLFIGRANYLHTLTIGKVRPSNGCCYISHGGAEILFADYEVYAAY